ncbi:MAG: hypothetical protein R6V10_11250 [bacterium]
MPDSSSYESEVGKSEYPEAEAPADDFLLRWDFSGSRVYGYDYELKAGIDSSISTTGQEMSQTVSTKGDMLLKSRKSNKADMVLKGLTLKMRREGKEGKPPATAKQDLPDKTVKGINHDGSPSADSGELDISMEIMIRMPADELSAGESSSIDMEAPLQVMGKDLPITGTDTVTLDKFVTIDGRRCARLVHEIKMEDLEVPEGEEGTYLARITGRGVVYFDLVDHCLVEGKVALLMSSRVETAPHVPEPREKYPEDLPDKIRMVMDSDNLISLGRQEKEE